MRRAARVLAALGCLFWILTGLGWYRGIRRIPVLGDVAEPLDRYPSLSVVLPARDEERAVGESVASLIAQDYPGELEVIAVDDRSTDGTGGILDRYLAENAKTLRKIRVNGLPEGWLGKNHALWLGAAEAAGEWFLFTDADVRFSPGCLRTAVEHTVRQRLDHLTVAPRIVSRGPLLKGFVAAFEVIFEITQRPWRARDPRAKEHVGVGAFNLVRREAYRAIGTHRAVAMRPDDDMRLAKRIKEGGFRQDVAYGEGLIEVEWHRTLGGAVRGLSKSIFPAMNYRLSLVVLATPPLLMINVLPFLGIFVARGRIRVLSGVSVAIIFAVYAYRSRYVGSKTPLWYATLHPFSVCAFVYAMWRSAYTALKYGGIEWRGTEYPLEALRENVVQGEDSARQARDAD